MELWRRLACMNSALTSGFTSMSLSSILDDVLDFLSSSLRPWDEEKRNLRRPKEVVLLGLNDFYQVEDRSKPPE